ncbi:MAG TPA: TetR/AcrR family transcriptional regulator [Acidimicrobiales bacterium]|nr:TetR/AcrR family transcriptional regulator [Acidimicrobiales bacterium]
MPKIVDHEDRRRELAEAAWRVIIKYGLDGTTTRLIAKESGYSAGVLAHYFESKDEILLEALRISHENIERRVPEVIEGREGLDALRAFCLDVLPTGEQQVRETHLEMSFWSRALVNSELLAVQRAESSRWRRVLQSLVEAAQRRGEIGDFDPRVVAVNLSALMDGLSIYALLYPDRFGKPELVRMLDAFLATLAPTRPLRSADGNAGTNTDGARSARRRPAPAASLRTRRRS